MKPMLIALSLMLGILCGCATAKRANTDESSQQRADIEKFLQGFADSQSKSDLDYFFVSVSRHNGPEVCYAFWMTGNSIIIIDLPVAKITDPIGYLWYAGKARIDLATGVVPNPEDVNSSTYLVDSAWVARILRDCLDSGIKIIVRKRAKKITGANAGEPCQSAMGHTGTARAPQFYRYAAC